MKDLILVTGSEGMIGSRFVELYPDKNSLHIPRQIEFDITNKDQVKAIVASYGFKAVVHFAAYTNVGEAEKQRNKKEDLCWQVNVEGTRNLAEAVKPYKNKIHFIQVSTDMVFSGDKFDPGPYLENHPTETESSRLSWYGYTKAEAEKVVKDVLGSEASILRMIYPVRTKFEAKEDWLRKAIRLYDEGKLYPMLSNQRISMTFIDEACLALNKIIDGNHFGVFHAASSDTTTPHEVVIYTLERLRDIKENIPSTTIEELLEKTGEVAARYPKYGGLLVDITEHKLGLEFSSWHQIVDKLISQGLGQS